MFDIDDGSIEIGDYVKVKSRDELLANKYYLEQPYSKSLIHTSGQPIEESWLGREGYVTELSFDSDANCHFFHLDSGPKIPASGLEVIRVSNGVKNDGCECGMTKHGFDGHSKWCPKYKSVWQEFDTDMNNGWGRQ